MDHSPTYVNFLSHAKKNHAPIKSSPLNQILQRPPTSEPLAPNSSQFHSQIEREAPRAIGKKKRKKEGPAPDAERIAAPAHARHRERREKKGQQQQQGKRKRAKQKEEPRRARARIELLLLRSFRSGSSRLNHRAASKFRAGDKIKM